MGTVPEPEQAGVPQGQHIGRRGEDGEGEEEGSGSS